jgi:integrase/recombinase XerD
VLVMLARLGLRRGEVAALTLEDVDWRAGELAITGKARRAERLPLPIDVGEAIVASGVSI